MRNFVVFALATASVERNLRFLGEEEERELENRELQATSTEDSSESSAATTPAQTTETTTTPAQTTPPFSGGSDSSDATTTEPSGGSGSATPSDPIPNLTEFGCYFAEGQYPTLNNNKKFEISSITCFIPKPVEITTTPSTAGRVLDDNFKPNITIEGKTSQTCKGKSNLYTCTFTDKPSIDKAYVEVTTDVYENKTTVNLGCNVGSNLHAKTEVRSEGSCDNKLFDEGSYTGKCEVDVDVVNKKQIFKMDFDDGEYTGCNCTETWSNGHKKAYKVPIEDRKIDGEQVIDFKPCKGGKKMTIQCTADGWKQTDKDTSSCQWDDGSVTSTVSALLLVLTVVLSIIF